NDFKVQGTVAPNSAYDLCNKIFTPEKAKMFDLSSVNYFVTGSEKVYVNTMKTFSSLFNTSIDKFCPGYGLSETVAVCSFSNPLKILSVNKNDFYNNKITVCDDEKNSLQLVSVGRNINSTKIEIIGLESKEKLNDGELGEVVINGPSVADGYYDITDERNDVFNIVDKNTRSLRTGDIGFVYNGDLFITGRQKEMIIINGQNFFPADFVEIIKRNVPEMVLPTIYAFAIDIDSKEHLIVVVENYSNTENYHDCATKIINAVNSYFSFSPYDVIFLAADHNLKKTDTGKIKIGDLRKDYLERNFKGWSWSDSVSIDVDCADEIEAFVLSEFNKVLPKNVDNMNSSFLEMGGDSFDLLTIVTNLEEKYGLKFDAKGFVSEPSVKGVSSYIRSLLSNEANN
ncbi:MAG: non-ribosomal peptide synthetase, partial [Oscillospiraceae bacterium]|nr:non-ribosomal peptide synthetase [Oscillospiraceae bacterium]